MRNLRMDHGFTLVELLVALVVSGVLMTGVYSAFLTQQQSYLAQDQVAEMQQNLRAGLNFFTYELRKAGYNPDDDGFQGITVAEDDIITFAYLADDDNIDNNDDDGNNSSEGVLASVDEAGEICTVRYDLYTSGGRQNLGRKMGPFDRAAVAENIDKIEFYYTMADGSQTLAPADLQDIRAVSISILAMTDRPDPHYSHTGSYRPASFADLGTEWTPTDNLNRRRRFQILTVTLRNAGI